MRAVLVQAPEPVQGGLAHDAVDVEPGVALELRHRHLQRRGEDPVRRPRIEAEVAEPLLKVKHVIAPDGRDPQVKQALTRLVPGLYELGPGVVFDHSVGEE